MKTAKTIGNMALMLILSAVIGTALLCAAYALPTGTIDVNVRKSAEVMEAEGTYPTLFSWCLSTLDNFTDSYMLIEAADPSEGSVLEKALANRPGIGARDPRAALTDYALRDGKHPVLAWIRDLAETLALPGQLFRDPDSQRDLSGNAGGGGLPAALQEGASEGDAAVPFDLGDADAHCTSEEYAVFRVL